MSEAPPIVFVWDGEAMVPTPGRFAALADRQFVVGETYRLIEHSDRSQATHNHQFAWLHHAWQSLPERYRHEPWAQTSEHLRKFALIRRGFCNTITYACGSRAEAERWAHNLRPFDEYAIVTINGTTVNYFTAQSQKKRAMGAKYFQASKTAILDFIAGLLEVEPATLEQARAA